MAATLQDYLASLQGKRVAVIGIGVSNTPLIETLLQGGISVTACDKSPRENFGELADRLEAMGATLQLGEHYLDGLDQDVIFRSPGIRPDIPPFLAAIQQGSVLTSEMEAFFQVCPCKIIAVTGSDGKTTTTSLIAEMLKNAGYTVHVGGNIGKPLLSEADRMGKDDVAVLELSSFQLMTLQASPDIAVFTNLSPNHLDVHTSMEEYAQAKENIFSHQGPGDLAIFNQDNDLTRAMAERAPGRVMKFSRRSALEEGTYVEHGMIYVAKSGPSFLQTASSSPASTTWKTIWRPLQLCRGWYRTRSFSTQRRPSPAWSIGLNWCAPRTGCVTITTPSPPAPLEPLRACGRSLKK